MSAVLAVCTAAKNAAPAVARASTGEKNAALEAMAAALDAAHEPVLAANAQDVEAARSAGVATAMIDRLSLSPERLTAIAAALRELIALTDPVGQIVRGFTLPNGLDVRQTRVPMGVIAMVYEGRPNVTVDAAGLALKSGNACVLRGSSSAINSNKALVKVLREALESVGLPADAVCLIEDTSRDSVKELGRARGIVDLLIPRGGAGLIQSVIADSQVPVIETGVGNCHVYVDRAADLDKATAIAINAKVHRPSVCNAAETLLVHADVAETFLPAVAEQLRGAGVELVGDDAAQQLVSAEPATDEDWDTEYLDLRLAVRVVGSLDDALEHIAKHGTLHTDGGEFGFGAEIGISTQKLHARGPMGLQELTTTKYIVEGDGQVRA